MKWIRRAWNRFVAWWRGPEEQRPALTATLTVARVEELPERLDVKLVYVVGEGEQLWSLAMVCPCGCGETLQMNLLPGPYACWSVQEHEDKTVSLEPSVNRTVGCRSHFHVRRGAVEWCEPRPDPLHAARERARGD